MFNTPIPISCLPGLKQWIKCLAEGHRTVTLLSLKLTTLRSPVQHSTNWANALCDKILKYCILDLWISFKYSVTIQNGWNNRISDGCLYAQICRGLGMHLVIYSNHDTVLFLLIVPIKGRFVWDGIHCIYIYQRLHNFLILLEYLGNLVRFSIYKGWNFPFLLGDILNIPLKGSI